MFTFLDEPASSVTLLSYKHVYTVYCIVSPWETEQTCCKLKELDLTDLMTVEEAKIFDANVTAWIWQGHAMDIRQGYRLYT